MPSLQPQSVYKRWFVHKNTGSSVERKPMLLTNHTNGTLCSSCMFGHRWNHLSYKKINTISFLICPQCPFLDPLINDCIRGCPETTITCPSMLYYPLTWSGWSMFPAERWDKLVSGTACFRYTTSVCIVRAGTIQWQPNWLSCLVSRYVAAL
jgi:hypothetical protein